MLYYEVVSDVVFDCDFSFDSHCDFVIEYDFDRGSVCVLHSSISLSMLIIIPFPLRFRLRFRFRWHSNFDFVCDSVLNFDFISHVDSDRDFVL